MFPGKERLPRYNLQQQLAWENRAGESDQVIWARTWSYKTFQRREVALHWKLRNLIGLEKSCDIFKPHAEIQRSVTTLLKIKIIRSEQGLFRNIAPRLSLFKPVYLNTLSPSTTLNQSTINTLLFVTHKLILVMVWSLIYLPALPCRLSGQPRRAGGWSTGTTWVVPGPSVPELKTETSTWLVSALFGF